MLIFGQGCRSLFKKKKKKKEDEEEKQNKTE